MYGVLLADGAVPRMPLPHCTPIQEEDEEPSGSPPPRGYPLRSCTSTPESNPSPQTRGGPRHTPKSKSTSILDPSKYSIQKSQYHNKCQHSGQQPTKAMHKQPAAAPGHPGQPGQPGQHQRTAKPYMGVLPAEEYLMRSSPVRTYPSQELPLEALLRPIPYAVHYISSQEPIYQVPRRTSSPVPSKSPARTSSPRRRGIITSPPAKQCVKPPKQETKDFKETKEKKEHKDDKIKGERSKRTSLPPSTGAVDRGVLHDKIEEIGVSVESSPCPRTERVAVKRRVDLPKSVGGRMESRSPGCFGCISRKALKAAGTPSITPVPTPGHVEDPASKLPTIGLNTATPTCELTQIGTALADRGHEVHLLITRCYKLLDRLKGLPINIILYESDNDLWCGDMSELENLYNGCIRTSFKNEFRQHVPGIINLCKNILSDEKTISKLVSMNFDLLLIDNVQWTRCFYVLPYKMDVPYASVYTNYEPWLSRSPQLPSSVPFHFSPPMSEKMSFFERLVNFMTILEYTVYPNAPTMDDRFVRDYAPDLPYVSLNTLAGRSVLWLLDNDIILDYPRPYMPNEVEIGGLTTFKPTKALPPDLDDYVTNAADGVILVSFGSSEAPLPNDATEKLVAVFRRLPQRIIWRIPIKTPPEQLPENVKIMQWLPQYDLLAHNNTRLFVTHCGANGQFEAMYHATPMVGIPMFAEQAYNAKRMDYHKYGRSLPRILEFTEEQLYEAIVEVLSNPVYKESISKASEIFGNRGQTPLERAVYWMEHVLQYGGQHLRSYALDMPWYQYLMLDIFVFLIILFTILATAMTYVVSCVCSCNHKQKAD